MDNDRDKHDPDSAQRLWRSLDELADTPAFVQRLQSEFPQFAAQFAAHLSRRDFLKLSGAALSLAGLAGCSHPPEETILPYVQQPEAIKQGESLFFSTAFPFDGYGFGVLAESFMGRPIKIEGNPDHPASLGATDTFAQASVLQLWDPDRSQSVLHKGQPDSWDALLAALQQRRERWRGNDGEGLRILTGSLTSPSLHGALKKLQQQFPKARWHQYQPVNRDHSRRGSELAFGQRLDPSYRFSQADLVISFDADPLTDLPGRLIYARDLAGRRQPTDPNNPMARLYAIEATPTLFGAFADHRFPVRASHIPFLVQQLARVLAGTPIPEDTPFPWLQALAQELQAHRGRCVLLGGERQPPEVHAAIYALNAELGNIGTTVVYRSPVEPAPIDQGESLRALVRAMGGGAVEDLVIIGANPVYTSPADLGFEEALRKVAFTLHHGLYLDETARHCRWHVPHPHYLETWSDIRAYDGTVSIQQPLIQPLYQSHGVHALLGAMTGNIGESDYQAVKRHWREHFGGEHFEHEWAQALHRGSVSQSASAVVNVSTSRAPTQDLPTALPDSGELELVFRPDPTVWDGEYANNGWLQELPKPLTKMTWDNAFYLGPSTAHRLGVKEAEVVRVEVGGRRIDGPVWIEPGHPEGSITAHLGYGRWSAGSIGNGRGFNAYRLRHSEHPWVATRVQLQKTGRRASLANAQHHNLMEGRDLVRHATLEEFRRNPDFAHKHEHRNEGTYYSLYPRYRYDGYKWGMSVNLNSCIGCSACVTACQAENNIPVVGKEQVSMGREMQWLRIDRYYQGAPDAPKTFLQPVPCMQCEKAPCEPVCPVEASIHDSEGINVQVYNRCIGTRFCSNNCPYKVRRFNFLQYSKDVPALNAQHNPEVTVRQRGVMEKCNYCLQRIANARINAEKRNEPIRDGEVVTACQAVCPTDAIIFGDLNDKGSQVNKAKASVLDYALLGELNTRPRTTYLAKVSNRNRKLDDQA